MIVPLVASHGEETIPVNSAGMLELTLDESCPLLAVRLMCGLTSVTDEYARVRATLPQLAALVDEPLDEVDGAMRHLVDSGYVFELDATLFQVSGRIMAPLRVGTV